MEERAAQAVASEEPEAAVGEPRAKKKRPEGRSSLGSILDDILEENPLESESRSVSTSAEVQVQTYLLEQTTKRESNPLQYWKQNASRFPPLADVAVKFLCAPCTSVDSERLFSSVSNVLNAKRNRLSADHVEMLVFLKKNLHLTMPKYVIESDSEELEKGVPWDFISHSNVYILVEL